MSDLKRIEFVIKCCKNSWRKHINLGICSNSLKVSTRNSKLLCIPCGFTREYVWQALINKRWTNEMMLNGIWIDNSLEYVKHWRFISNLENKHIQIAAKEEGTSFAKYKNWQYVDLFEIALQLGKYAKKYKCVSIDIDVRTRDFKYIFRHTFILCRNISHDSELNLQKQPNIVLIDSYINTRSVRIINFDEDKFRKLLLETSNGSNFVRQWNSLFECSENEIQIPYQIIVNLCYYTR